jgi:hypothetical protein
MSKRNVNRQETHNPSRTLPVSEFLSVGPLFQEVVRGVIELHGQPPF